MRFCANHPARTTGRQARTDAAESLARKFPRVLMFVVTVQTYTLFDKVVSTYSSNVQTFDLRLPTWPCFLVAWLGDVSAVLLIAVRTYRLIFDPHAMSQAAQQIRPVE